MDCWEVDSVPRRIPLALRHKKNGRRMRDTRLLDIELLSRQAQGRSANRVHFLPIRLGPWSGASRFAFVERRRDPNDAVELAPKALYGLAFQSLESRIPWFVQGTDGDCV